MLCRFPSRQGPGYARPGGGFGPLQLPVAAFESKVVERLAQAGEIHADERIARVKKNRADLTEGNALDHAVRPCDLRSPAMIWNRNIRR